MLTFYDFPNTDVKKNVDIYPIERQHIDGLFQDSSNSSALAMELLQSCTKPLTWISSSLQYTVYTTWTTQAIMIQEAWCWLMSKVDPLS